MQTAKTENIKIAHTATFPVDGKVYEVSHPFGTARNVFRETSGWYHLAELDVAESKRRQGIGKALLQVSFEHAVSLQAKIIFGAIVSRECIHAMQAVFGEDAVIIRNLGEYLKPGQDIADGVHTSATLWREL